MRTANHIGAAAPVLADHLLAHRHPVDLTAGHKDEARELGSGAGFRGQGKTNNGNSPGAVVLGQPGITAGPNMTSREIAELTGKEHRNVIRDARKMLAELHGEGGLLSFEHTQVDTQNGQQYPVLRLPKRETLILVSGYSVTMRPRIIDRLEELERAAADPVLPDFSNPAAAARAWADQHEQRQRLEAKNRQQAEALAIAPPKAAGLDRIATASDGSVGLRLAAKVANVPEQEFIAYLIAHGWLYRQGGRSGLLCKADKLRAGQIEMKRIEVPGPNGATLAVARVFITTRGLARLAELIERKAPHLRNVNDVPAPAQIQLPLQIEPVNEQEGGAP